MKVYSLHALQRTTQAKLLTMFFLLWRPSRSSAYRFIDRPAFRSYKVKHRADSNIRLFASNGNRPLPSNDGSGDNSNSNNKDTERAWPPPLEASYSFYGTDDNDYEGFGAADYDESSDMEDTSEEPNVMSTTYDSFPDQSVPQESSAAAVVPPTRKSLALFADEDDGYALESSHTDDVSTQSVAAPPRLSTLFPDFDVEQQESTNVPLAPTEEEQSLSAEAPPPRVGIRRPEGREELYIKGSKGDVITTDAESLKSKLEYFEKAIYDANKGEKFNINSNKQLSTALFGNPNESTDKDSLYAIASAGNKMADLILQYRKAKVDLRKVEKKTENKDKGVYVSSAIKNANSSSTLDPLLLVDASAYIFRAYYSMPPFHRADGTPVGAVLGFCNMLNRLVLNRLLEGERPRLVLVFDPVGKNFRHELYPDYKANRKECPMDLKPQFALIRAVAQAYGIHELEAESYEADDVIASLVTMAMKEGVDCHILSGDKDLMQLITPLERTESYVHIIDPMSMARVDYTAVVEKWGVGPELVGDLLAIMGDSSDNIPGIKGLGPKTGTSLLLQHKSLDAILSDPSCIEKTAQRTKIEQSIEIARLSRQLVDLVRDIPLERMTFPEDCSSVADLRMEELDPGRLLKFYQNMGFKDLARRLEGRLSRNPVPMQKKKSAWKGREKERIPTPTDFDDVPF